MEEEKKKEQTNDEDRMINILQLSQWLSLATSGHKNFLIKPKDLQMLYLIFLWEYISTMVGEGYHGAITEQLIKNDEQIMLPEKSLARLVQIFFDGKYHQLFERINNM